MAWIIGIGVALFLLFAFPRQMFGLIAFLAVMGGGIWVYSDMSTKVQKAEEAKVLLTARYETELCPASHPIRVWFENGTKRTINSLYFSVEGYQPRHSSSQIRNSYLNSDRIIGPGETHISCWNPRSYGLEEVPLNLNWKAPLISVRFADE